jgi:hypothetical protein
MRAGSSLKRESKSDVTSVALPVSSEQAAACIDAMFENLTELRRLDSCVAPYDSPVCLEHVLAMSSPIAIYVHG